MSQQTIRKLLETALAAVAPALPTQYENADFDAPASAYQSVTFQFGPPDNRVYGAGFYEEPGYMQVLLRYPTGIGSGDAAERAQAIRNAFARGTSFAEGGVTVTIHKTPEVKGALVDGDRYEVPVRVWYHAQIFSP